MTDSHTNDAEMSATLDAYRDELASERFKNLALYARIDRLSLILRQIQKAERIEAIQEMAEAALESWGGS